MSKKSRADRNFKFETLQLHVGQETADAVTDARAVPMYSTIHSMPLTDLVLRMQVIFMEDLQILQRMFSRKEQQHLKVVLQHLQLVRVRQQLHTLFRTLHLQETISLQQRISTEEHTTFLHTHLQITILRQHSLIRLIHQLLKLLSRTIQKLFTQRLLEIQIQKLQIQKQSPRQHMHTRFHSLSTAHLQHRIFFVLSSMEQTLQFIQLLSLSVVTERLSVVLLLTEESLTGKHQVNFHSLQSQTQVIME